jgi:hypothetical protein
MYGLTSSALNLHFRLMHYKIKHLEHESPYLQKECLWMKKAARMSLALKRQGADHTSLSWLNQSSSTSLKTTNSHVTQPSQSKAISTI